MAPVRRPRKPTITTSTIAIAHAQLKAERQQLFECLQALHDARTHAEHVLALGHADADQDGLLTVVVERLGGRIDVTAPDGRDILELDHLARIRNLDGNGLDVLDAPEFTVGCHDDLALAGVDAAPRQDHVFADQRVANGGDRKAQLGDSCRREFDPDRLALDSVEVDALHGGYHVQLVLEPLGHLVQLGQAESGTGQRRAHHRDVPEVVVHEGADRGVRKLRRRVDDLVANVLPDDVEIGLLILVEDLDAHLGVSVSRPRVDVVALGDAGERLLDGAGDEELDVLRFHAGHEGGHHGIAHRDRRIFLARKVADHAEAVHDQREDDDEDQRLVAKREAGQIHGAVRSRP